MGRSASLDTAGSAGDGEDGSVSPAAAGSPAVASETGAASPVSPCPSTASELAESESAAPAAGTVPGCGVSGTAAAVVRTPLLGGGAAPRCPRAERPPENATPSPNRSTSQDLRPADLGALAPPAQALRKPGNPTAGDRSTSVFMQFEPTLPCSHTHHDRECGGANSSPQRRPHLPKRWNPCDRKRPAVGGGLRGYPAVIKSRS